MGRGTARRSRVVEGQIRATADVLPSLPLHCATRIRYGPSRDGISRPFQLSRIAPSSTSRSTAECTAGMAARHSPSADSARATSLGQMVAFGERDASSASIASRV